MSINRYNTKKFYNSILHLKIHELLLSLKKGNLCIIKIQILKFLLDNLVKLYNQLGSKE